MQEGKKISLSSLLGENKNVFINFGKLDAVAIEALKGKDMLQNSG